MATLSYPSEYVLHLGDGWVDTRKLERAFRNCGSALTGPIDTVVVRISAGCSLMADVIVRLLSFCHQVLATTKRLRLEFAGGTDGCMGYLDRIGFFDCLSRDAETVPARPKLSSAAFYRGNNCGLVEIERFSGNVEADRSLPERLGRAVERGCSSRHDRVQVAGAISRIVSELVGNVPEHSGTPLDAYAVLQTYSKKVTIAVSDSGKGIMGTLRPALERRHSPLAKLSETQLLIEMFRKGLSSLDGDERGLGLMTCAQIAIRYRADLDVRLLNQRVLLKPSGNAYRANTAYTEEGLPLLWGTHISFSLKLD